MTSSGDLLVDRRFAYAQSYLAAGDAAAAADLLVQITHVMPRWAEGWFALGEAYEKIGEREKAARAFVTADERDSSRKLGAAVRATALKGETPDHLPAAYLTALFDDYAPRFDEHLTQVLDYRVPSFLVSELASWCGKNGRGKHFENVIDLGCGTGLLGEDLRHYAVQLTGVDLSAAMLARAKQRGCYNRLAQGDIVSFLETAAPESFDLACAADVLVYLGDLHPLARVMARALRSGGLFLFSVQAGGGGDYHLGQDLRFSHSEPYLRELAAGAGLDTLVFQYVTLRQNAGKPVPGFLIMWMKSGGCIAECAASRKI